MKGVMSLPTGYGKSKTLLFVMEHELGIVSANLI